MSRRKTIPRRCATLVAGWSLRHPEGRNAVEEPALRRLVSKATPATQSRINRRDVVLAGGRTGAVATPGRTAQRKRTRRDPTRFACHDRTPIGTCRPGRRVANAGEALATIRPGRSLKASTSNMARPKAIRDVQQTTAASERIWIACRLSERNGGDRRKLGRRDACNAQRLLREGSQPAWAETPALGTAARSRGRLSLAAR